MQDLKNYLNDRLELLQTITAGSDSDNLTTLGQIHELKILLLWIEEHETEDKTPCNN